jgi:hyperosmotically inducible periplasmic protein
VSKQRLSTALRIAALAVVLGSSATMIAAQMKPDNTGTNKGDAMSADKQKMNASDRALTQKIRKAVMSDKSLSTYAHNVKIISQDGVVTLKGPVRSDDEKKTILARATEATGTADKVTDQMSVTPSSK